MFKAINREISAVMERDPAARSRLEVFLCYPGFHAILYHRMSHWLWRKKWKLLARFISSIARLLTGIEIHPGAKIGTSFFIDHGMGVVIGETATIGDNVTIYHGVTLGGVSLEREIRHPQIGNNVIIGSGAQLLGPINVGDNARVGSNAVVVKDVPEGATMVGVPARAVSRPVVPLAEPTMKEKFEAYGVDHGELPDPVARTLDGVLQEVESLKRQITELELRNTSLEKNLEATANEWELSEK